MRFPDYSLLQISDVHIKTDGLLYGRLDTEAGLRAILDRVASSDFRPDALLVTGDLANWGETESYTWLRDTFNSYAEKWSCEVIYTKGNHDVDPAAFRDALFDGIPAADPIDRVSWVGELRIITLDSTIEGRHEGEFTESQLSWLSKTLEVPAAAGTIVVMHHPPIPSPSALLNAVGFQNSAELADVVRGTDVHMIVSGHCHYAGAGSLAGIPVWVSPAAIYETDTLTETRQTAIDGGGFSRIDVFGDSVVATAIRAHEAADVLYDMTQREALEQMGLSSKSE